MSAKTSSTPGVPSPSDPRAKRLNALSWLIGIPLWLDAATDDHSVIRQAGLSGNGGSCSPQPGGSAGWSGGEDARHEWSKANCYSEYDGTRGYPDDHL